MVLKVAQQSDVAPFMVMDVLRAAIERQEAGKDVLHLEIGQPGFSAPKAARQAVAKAMEVDNLGYTDSAGIAPLRAGISMRYKALYGVDVPPERISATTGSSGGFLLTFLACFDPGDRVALADPSYPCYRNILKALGMEPVRLKVGPETRFQPTPEAIEAAGDIAGVIVASPSNPAGAMFAPGELGRLADWCHAKGIRFISDEIYHGLTYGRAAETAATSPSAVVVNSFSKYFAMTGWRIGWCVLPEDLIERFYRLSVNLFISPPTISQFAALAALDCTEELEGYRRIYAENREVMLDALAARGLTPAAPPEGAFYIYVDTTSISNDSAELCEAMLNEIGVAATPGYDFDPEEGGKYVRFSFCASKADVAEAARRLKTWRR